MLTESDIHETTDDPIFDPILRTMLNGPRHPTTPEEDWAVIKAQLNQMPKDMLMKPSYFDVKQRIFNIITFIEDIDAVSFPWEYLINRRNRTLYEDVLRCCMNYHRDKIDDILRTIVTLEHNDFDRMAVWERLINIVPSTQLSPIVLENLQAIRQITAADPSRWPNEWDGLFWPSLNTLLTYLGQSYAPWLNVLRSFPQSDQLDRLIWTFELSDNLFQALASLTPLSQEQRDEKLRQMSVHFLTVPARYWFAINEIENITFRCESAIDLFDYGVVVNEEVYWTIYNWMLSAEVSWTHYGIFTSYGLDERLLDSPTIRYLQKRMNEQFETREIEPNTEEWDVSTESLNSWNTIIHQALEGTD